MGRPKLALPLGARAVIEHVVAALRTGGAEPVVVVVGPHVAELAPLARSAGAEVCLLPEATPDMRATVGHGLNWIEARYTPRPDDLWLLAPADHPTLDAPIVGALCEAIAVEPTKSIAVPTWGGRRGHPTLLAWRHVAGLRALPAGQGINSYLRAGSADVLEVPAGPNVLVDLDTPEDYARLRKAFP
jgi:CTP:molybdopterin cytidylyltransferase MocA